MRVTERTEFGARANESREARGLTQKRVCELLGIKQSTLADIETKANGSTYTAQLANLYGVNALWLATGEGPKVDESLTWREIAINLAAAQDAAEKGQRFATFCTLVDKVYDLGRAER